MQLSALVPPGIARYVPAAHGWQRMPLSLLIASENLPEGHGSGDVVAG